MSEEMPGREAGGARFTLTKRRNLVGRGGERSPLIPPTWKTHDWRLRCLGGGRAENKQEDCFKSGHDQSHPPSPSKDYFPGETASEVNYTEMNIWGLPMKKTVAQHSSVRPPPGRSSPVITPSCWCSLLITSHSTQP